MIKLLTFLFVSLTVQLAFAVNPDPNLSQTRQGAEGYGPPHDGAVNCETCPGYQAQSQLLPKSDHSQFLSESAAPSASPAPAGKAKGADVTPAAKPKK